MLHIPVRIFEKDGTLVDIGHSEENQGDPLVCDTEFAALLLGSMKEDSPFLYYEANCVVYAVIPANGGRTVILGPACYTSETRTPSYAVAMLHHVEHPDSYIINHVDLMLFAESVLLIFHSHSDVELSVEALVSQSTDTEYTPDMKANAYSIIYQHRENSTSHNSYAQEVREQKAIREGNIEALKKSWDEVQMGKIGRLAHDDITHYRFLAIVNITLSSRSAMEGGVLPEVAYSVADSYSMKVSELTDPVEIGRLFRSAEVHFAELVQALTHKNDSNIYIRRCKEIIHDRLNEKIYEEDLADELGITRSYLSQLFYQETGMHLSEYILRQKVKSSEYLLIYPDIPLGRIAATFGFSSQSHYGQAFKRFKGVTPGQYREKHLKLEK